MALFKHWRYLVLALLSVAALTAFAACGDDEEEKATTTPGASGEPTDMAPDADQKMTVNIRAEPNTIDPQGHSYTYEANVVKNTYMTLFDQDPKTSELTPYAA